MASGAMMTRYRVKSEQGFTLIELMVAVAILAIIVSIAIPAYTDQVVRTNRTEGKSLLMGTAQALERCFTRFNAYNADDCTVAFPITSENGWYQLAESDQTIGASSFSLVAAPQDAQATRDTDCGSLSLTHTGARGVTGSSPPADCW